MDSTHQESWDSMYAQEFNNHHVHKIIQVVESFYILDSFLL